MTKRKTRRGGQKVRRDRLDRTRRAIPGSDSNCAAAVFYMIGYTDLDETRYLERRSPEGLHLVEEVLPMLQQAYGDVHVEELTPDSLDHNDVTIAYIHWEEKAHYFIIVREDQLFVVDPQFRVREPYTEYLKRFINIKNVYYLDSVRRDNGDNLVTREIIDRVLGPDHVGYLGDYEPDIDDLFKRPSPDDEIPDVSVSIPDVPESRPKPKRYKIRKEP